MTVVLALVPKFLISYFVLNSYFALYIVKPQWFNHILKNAYNRLTIIIKRTRADFPIALIEVQEHFK